MIIQIVDLYSPDNLVTFNTRSTTITAYPKWFLLSFNIDKRETAESVEIIIKFFIMVCLNLITAKSQMFLIVGIGSNQYGDIFNKYVDDCINSYKTDNANNIIKDKTNNYYIFNNLINYNMLFHYYISYKTKYPGKSMNYFLNNYMVKESKDNNTTFNYVRNNQNLAIVELPNVSLFHKPVQSKIYNDYINYYFDYIYKLLPYFNLKYEDGKPVVTYKSRKFNFINYLQVPIQKDKQFVDVIDKLRNCDKSNLIIKQFSVTNIPKPKPKTKNQSQNEIKDKYTLGYRKSEDGSLVNSKIRCNTCLKLNPSFIDKLSQYFCGKTCQFIHYVNQED